MRRVLSKNDYAKSANDPRQYSYADTDDSKARHILGLDTTHLKSSRGTSVSSSSTNKLRSVTFSNATTAAVSVTDSSQSGRDTPSSLGRKGSSSLLRRNKKTDFQIDTLKPKGSSSSLRSFYDKSRTPLIVSQQTSESSRRDFALRKGAPAVVSTPTQETAHSRQIRLMTELPKSSSKDRSKLTPDLTKYDNSSTRSLVPSVAESVSDTAESLSSLLSGSRISILRNSTPRNSMLSPISRKVEHFFRNAAPDVDPARAKINVKRPKAGTKNWFDSLDTDSSEDEDLQREPHLTDDFALNMTSVLNPGQSKKKPASSVPHDLAELPTEVPDDFYADRNDSQLLPDHASSATSRGSNVNHLGKRKIGVFNNADLAKQSILDLDSSDEEDGSDESSHKAPEINNKSRTPSSSRSNLRPIPIARIETSVPQTLTSEISTKTSSELRNAHVMKQPVPRRVSSRMITYLDDCSTETVTQQEDLLTSFPQTPTDTPSRSSSLREYTVSEDEAVTNTKVMTVTRQEESLIAAMRLKKTAMKRAQAVAHRQSALSILERNSTSSALRAPPRSGQRDSSGGVSKPQSPTSQPRTRPPIPSTQHSQRTDSVTTIQTDSMRQPSIRSSIATYLSEGSDDLQLPYSLTDGLPMGSSHPRRASSLISDRPRSHRDTFLSEVSTSTYTASPSDWSPSVRDSHVVELDPINRQLLRGEIPSQLFLERPFLGWEAQANMQSAH